MVAFKSAVLYFFVIAFSVGGFATSSFPEATAPRGIKEPKVQVSYGRLEEFVGKKAAIREIEAILADDTSYLTGFELPIDLSTFSAQEQARLQLVVTHHDGGDWLPILGATYNAPGLLTPRARTAVNEFALKVFNKLMPTARPKIDIFQQRDSLKNVYYLSQVRPDYELLERAGLIGVERLFSGHAVENLFDIPNFKSPTGYLNCASNVFASLLPRANKRTARYVGMNSLEPLFKAYFQEVKPPLQMGDVVYFMIPGNFHVFVYSGTDRATGARIGFTKNGKELGVFTFMKFDDIYRFYKPFNITAIKYYRLVKPMPVGLFDQFPASTNIPESAHTASRVVVLPEVLKVIKNELEPSDIPVLRGNY